MGKVAAQLAENLDAMDLDADDSGDDGDVPIFTPELARLKAKEQGKEVAESSGADDDDDD